ncbi:MAG: hypothetical protein OHK0029_12820 [Armatimonadaceae bacterium]
MSLEHPTTDSSLLPIPLLNSVVFRIIPSDRADTDGTAGAEEAEVTAFLIRQFSGPLAEHTAQCQQFLAFLDSEAQTKFGEPFVALSPDRQDALLARAETDPDWGGFFRRFVEWVQEGFYTSPVAWKMIGWSVKG